MKKDIFSRLDNLHKKSIELVKQFKELPDKDIKRNHIELLSSKIATSLITLKICFQFENTNKEAFAKLLKNDETLIENYKHNFQKSIIEAILVTTLFHTELVLRIFYSKLTSINNPTKERNINRIIAKLFEDTENNWQKDEAKLLVLLCTIRNTIHTGGIYYKKPEGDSLIYKGKKYKFEFNKAFEFPSDSHILDLLSDLLDSLNDLFNSEKIKDLGYIEHPSYFALGYVSQKKM
jgi:hypothetical protein